MLSEQINALHIQNPAISCNNTQQRALNYLPLNEIAKELFKPLDGFTGGIQVLSKESLALEEYAQQVFKQRDIQGLLYTAWRQEVQFGANMPSF